MDTVSFLLGSGFSVANGIPLVSEINRRLLEIKEEDLFLDTDGSAILLNGQEKIIRYNWEYEKFFVEFLKFYSTKVLSNFSDFNYEIVFDYLTAYSRFNKHKEELHDFCEQFRNNFLKSHNSIFNDGNLISRFTDVFLQIISNYLQIPKYYEDVGLGNYPPYDSFASLLRELLINNVIKVHTLNHDLLFEHIASKLSDLWQHFTDGYHDNNSPYYGEVYTRERIHKTYKVRLKRFTDTFDKPLALYKLHGSIDTYTDIASSDETRIKRDYGVSSILKEVYDENT